MYFTDTKCYLDLFPAKPKDAVENDYLYITWFGPVPIMSCGRVEYIEALLRRREHIKKSFIYDTFT